MDGAAVARETELSEDALRGWGRRLGRAAAEAKAFVALFGPLGAGKTTLVQAACAGAGVEEPVTSPTFTLVHRYRSPGGPVYHVDLYRIADPSELTELGWDDLVAGEGPVFVEWAERAGEALPGDRWDVHLGMGSAGETRRLRVVPRGQVPLPPSPEDPECSGSP